MADSGQLTPNSAAAPPPPPPPAPRPLNKLVLRRSWFEPYVRFWWLFALFLFATAAFYAVSAVLNLSTDQQLIEHGTLVQATVGGTAARHLPAETSVDLTF